MSNTGSMKSRQSKSGQPARYASPSGASALMAETFADAPEARSRKSCADGKSRPMRWSRAAVTASCLAARRGGPWSRCTPFQARPTPPAYRQNAPSRQARSSRGAQTAEGRRPPQRFPNRGASGPPGRVAEPRQGQPHTPEKRPRRRPIPSWGKPEERRMYPRHEGSPSLALPPAGCIW